MCPSYMGWVGSIGKKETKRKEKESEKKKREKEKRKKEKETTYNKCAQIQLMCPTATNGMGSFVDLIWGPRALHNH